MNDPGSISGDSFVELLGLDASDTRVQSSLARFARGKQPELDPEDGDDLVDWVTINELGLEFGFEDEAYVRALEPDARRSGPLLLSQVYFYGDTASTQPFPYALPFELDFKDNADSVRQKMNQFEKLRRSYVRDAWPLPQFNLAIAYGQASGMLESVFCYLPYVPWPSLPGETELVSAFGPDVFVSLFGLRWSNAQLRERLAPLGFEEKLAEIRVEQTADLRMEHGLELLFAPGNQVKAADQRYPRTLSLAGVTFYANRELDARQWGGRLPHDLSFSDTQADMGAKVGTSPVLQSDDQLSGEIVWHMDDYTLSVLYSNLENRPLRIRMMAPGYWDASS